ncbi:MAG: hypothetical protein MPF33_03715 [Candidatus Aramenus sp.]|nr:hypothetical protein [Candidatus Aramenus sp.]
MLEKVIQGLRYSVKYDKSVLRRYTILGAFDGILLATGILISSSAVKILPQDIFLSVASGIIAIAISSTWNALVVEAKEREKEFRDLERQMMRKLDGTIYEYGMKSTIVLSALLHGASPFLGLIPILVYTYTRSVMLGVGASLASLFVLGVLYEGDLKEKLVSGVIIFIAGVVTVLITALISR